MILVHWHAYRVTGTEDRLVGEFWASDSPDEAYRRAIEELRCRVDVIRRNGLPPRNVESYTSHNGHNGDVL